VAFGGTSQKESLEGVPPIGEAKRQQIPRSLLFQEKAAWSTPPNLRSAGSIGSASQCPSLPFLETIGTIAINGCAKGVNVNLPPQLEEMVREKVSPRLCTSASEVVREALRLADEKDRLQAAKLVQLRQDVREGLESGRPPPQAPNKSNAKVGRGALPRGA